MSQLLGPGAHACHMYTLIRAHLMIVGCFSYEEYDVGHALHLQLFDRYHIDIPLPVVRQKVMCSGKPIGPALTP
jgi:hypothetical protein